MKIIAIIPARYESSRLPGKVLEKIAGQSILSRVYQKAKESNVFSEIIVATDHKSILDHCKAENMDVRMTSSDHISGTDRVAEVARSSKADIVINIQGDEPFIEVSCIQKLVHLMKDEEVQIATLCKKINDETDLFDYNVVKLVKDQTERVLYFSRQAIPACRDLPYREWLNKTDYYQHIGLYGFRNRILQSLVKMSPSSLEISEKLEQLRWMENGYQVQCAVVQSESFGIDTPEDLEKARSIYK